MLGHVLLPLYLLALRVNQLAVLLSVDVLKEIRLVSQPLIVLPALPFLVILDRRHLGIFLLAHERLRLAAAVDVAVLLHVLRPERGLVAYETHTVDSLLHVLSCGDFLSHFVEVLHHHKFFSALHTSSIQVLIE